MQPKNLWRTTNRNFGKFEGMNKPVDPVTFGRRVRDRRMELGWSQGKLATASGYSQTNIGWIETGKAKDPTKQALRLAQALNTTADWLLYEKGQKELGPPAMTREEIRKALDELPADAQLEFRIAVTEMLANRGIKRKKA